VPIEIKVHRLRFDRHWQDLVSESVLIDNAGVALRQVLSRCWWKNAKGLRLLKFQAAATVSRHVLIAAARKVRCVWADVRWR
jgi:hypothetical protein